MRKFHVKLIWSVQKRRMDLFKVFLKAYFWTVVVIQGLDAPPNYNVHNPPETSFTCEGKVVGGYYADPESSCQLFHICVRLDETQVQDFRFLCPNDTLFDQENFVCANWRDVDCSKATNYYNKNLDLFKPSEEEVEHVHWDEETKTASVNEQMRRKRQLLEAPVSPNDKLANTSFSCNGLVPGGYYADVESGCVVFHVCKLSENGTLVDNKFQCLNGTLFDQKKLICRTFDKVNCAQALQDYNSSLEHQLSSIVLQVKMADKDEATSMTTTESSLATNESCCSVEQPIIGSVWITNATKDYSMEGMDNFLISQNITPENFVSSYNVTLAEQSEEQYDTSLESL